MILGLTAKNPFSFITIFLSSFFFCSFSSLFPFFPFYSIFFLLFLIQRGDSTFSGGHGPLVPPLAIRAWPCHCPVSIIIQRSSSLFSDILYGRLRVPHVRGLLVEREPVDWTRPTGWPRSSRLRTAGEDFDSVVASLEDVIPTAEDRTMWREMIMLLFVQRPRHRSRLRKKGDSIFHHTPNVRQCCTNNCAVIPIS